MRFLVDTQTWLWMAAAPDRLTPDAHAIVEATGNDLYLSSASAWEIAIKYALGKLQLPDVPESYVPSRMTILRTLPLPIAHSHALRVRTLPPHHRDPFDRLLVAQALEEGMSLITADRVFAQYDIAVTWSQ